MRGRPIKHGDDSTITVTSKNAKTRLQSGSERRAIINLILDAGGSMTIGQVCEEFGFDCRPRIHALIRANWLEVKS